MARTKEERAAEQRAVSKEGQTDVLVSWLQEQGWTVYQGVKLPQVGCIVLPRIDVLAVRPDGKTWAIFVEEGICNNRGTQIRDSQFVNWVSVGSAYLSDEEASFDTGVNEKCGLGTLGLYKEFKKYGKASSNQTRPDRVAKLAELLSTMTPR